MTYNLFGGTENLAQLQQQPHRRTAESMLHYGEFTPCPVELRSTGAGRVGGGMYYKQGLETERMHCRLLSKFADHR